MGVYLHAKCEVSSMILTSFREGGVVLPASPPPPPQKETPKKPTQIRVNRKVVTVKSACKWNNFSKGFAFSRLAVVILSYKWNDFSKRFEFTLSLM